MTLSRRSTLKLPLVFAMTQTNLNQLPPNLLSDEHFAFIKALRLPTFTVDGMTLNKRLTLIVRNGHIEQVFYPVFPPDKHADEVIAWLKKHPVNA
jgi:peroxiredoxin